MHGHTYINFSNLPVSGPCIPSYKHGNYNKKLTCTKEERNDVA